MENETFHIGQSFDPYFVDIYKGNKSREYFKTNKIQMIEGQSAEDVCLTQRQYNCLDPPMDLRFSDPQLTLDRVTTRKSIL